MAAVAAEMLVKAAAVRPRDVAADAPRDRSIALVAPAAAALCLALPRSGGGGGGGGGGSSNSVLATLYGVLAGCMGSALDLMAMVVDGATRLGHVVSADKLERPRAVIGLTVSCILVALRHLGPVSEPPPPPPANTPQVAAGDNGAGDSA
ncbi:unnamed protein product, partial [Ectocarpus sp. 12 AP-2014]